MAARRVTLSVPLPRTAAELPSLEFPELSLPEFAAVLGGAVRPSSVGAPDEPPGGASGAGGSETDALGAEDGAACPIGTGLGTRRVHLVRGGA